MVCLPERKPPAKPSTARLSGSPVITDPLSRRSSESTAQVQAFLLRISQSQTRKDRFHRRKQRLLIQWRNCRESALFACRFDGQPERSPYNLPLAIRARSSPVTDGQLFAAINLLRRKARAFLPARAARGRRVARRCRRNVVQERARPDESRR